VHPDVSQVDRESQSNPVGLFPMPANLRYLEYMDVGNAEYAKLGYGDADYDEANVMAAQEKVQAIVGLPML
jgi:hypothetical protein